MGEKTRGALGNPPAFMAGHVQGKGKPCYSCFPSTATEFCLGYLHIPHVDAVPVLVLPCIVSVLKASVSENRREAGRVEMPSRSAPRAGNEKQQRTAERMSQVWLVSTLKRDPIE